MGKGGLPSLDKQLYIRESGAELANALRTADTFAGRLRGLLFRSELADGEGLHLIPCRSVHTFGMTYPIDVLHLDARGRIVALETLAPNRFGQSWRGTVSIVELPAGTLERAEAEAGQSVDYHHNQIEER